MKLNTSRRRTAPVWLMGLTNTVFGMYGGWGYAWHAVAGSYAVDAGVSLAASILLAVLMVCLSRRRRQQLG